MGQSELHAELGRRLETAKHRLAEASAEVWLRTRQIAELEVALAAISAAYRARRKEKVE